ncbi:MAG: endonuclease/exonuclease/phosphatase family protein [Pirellulales bacterium]
MTSPPDSNAISPPEAAAQAGPDMLTPARAVTRQSSRSSSNDGVSPGAKRSLGQTLSAKLVTPGALWRVTAVLAILALLRIVAHDATLLLVWVNSFTLYVYLPAYAVLLCALVLRRKRLAVVAAGIVACHLAWVGPGFLPAGSLPPHLADAPTIRIVSANVLFSNDQHEALIAEIDRHEPDVFVLIEYAHPWREALRGQSMFKRFPHRIESPRADAFGIAMFSKVPLTDARIWTIEGLPVARARVRLGGRDVEIFGIHPPPPKRSAQLRQSTAFWEVLRAELKGLPHPVIVVGDFNATVYSHAYGQLLADGLVSAHQQRGRGFATSWPNGQTLIPPIRIDHAMFAPELACVRVCEGRGAGSDHKPIIVDIAAPVDASQHSRED